MLQRLVDLGSFDILQKKLERWLGSYSVSLLRLFHSVGYRHRSVLAI